MMRRLKSSVEIEETDLLKRRCATTGNAGAGLTAMWRYGALLAASFLLAGCGPGGQPAQNTGAQSDVKHGVVMDPGNLRQPGPQSSRVSAAEFLPDPRLTPGDVLDVAREDVCVSGYSKNVRNVPADVKRKVYEEYGISSHKSGEYEVDHLISLELGGSNSIKNLWPQSYLTEPWNAHVKDRLEDRLHAMICKGQIDMKTAQHEIAVDWIAAYKKYVGPEPIAKPRRAAAVEAAPETEQAAAPSDQNNGGAGDENTKVWVNTHSGVYWMPGTEYYGKTKEGTYMTEKQAVEQGYHSPGKK